MLIIAIFTIVAKVAIVSIVTILILSFAQCYFRMSVAIADLSKIHV